jgi:hypothetical protein
MMVTIIGTGQTIDWTKCASSFGFTQPSRAYLGGPTLVNWPGATKAQLKGAATRKYLGIFDADPLLNAFLSCLYQGQTER